MVIGPGEGSRVVRVVVRAVGPVGVEWRGVGAVVRVVEAAGAAAGAVHAADAPNVLGSAFPLVEGSAGWFGPNAMGKIVRNTCKI